MLFKAYLVFLFSFKTMKKTLVLLLLFFGLSSCRTEVSPKDIVNINGYWEIKETVLADGNSKPFKVSETIDFFEIKNNKGFRKKVMPQIDGTYLVNDQQEHIELKEEKNHFYINYDTPYGKWRDEVISVTPEALVLLNKEGIEFHYKRPVKFSIK